MKSPLPEKLISVVAPFECLLCGTEGQIICSNCVPVLAKQPRGVCFLCNGLSQDFKTCASCRRKTKLKCVWVSSRYEGYTKEVIRKFKYERVRSAYLPLAKLIEQTVIAKDYDLIVPVPIVSGRYRLRGYNQSQLLAKYLSQSWRIPLFDGLHRTGQARQVGHTKSERIKLLKDSFYVSNPETLVGKKVLLVDDVITTGTTLTLCSENLVNNGAKSVEAAVVAKP